MLVMRTTKSPAYPVGEFIRTEQPIELHDPPFAVNPLGLYSVQPRTLFREQATDDPPPPAALLDFSIVFAEPPANLLGDVPARVVPDEEKNFLAELFEPLQAPREKLRGYGAYGPSVDEPYPHVVEPGKVEPVAGSSFATDCWIMRGGLPSSQKALKVGKATRLHQHSSKKPMAHSGSPSAISISRSRRLFFVRTGGLGR